MKTFFSILFLFCLLSTAIFPQVWQLQTSNIPANATAQDFSPVGDNICWALWTTDNSGTGEYLNGFLRTTDGGTTWESDTIQGAVNGSPWWIDALDANNAYAAIESWSAWGMQGIYKTTDGGTTWEKNQTLYANSNYGPAYIHFFDANNGVVVGEKDPNTGCLEIYTTTNSGTDWNPVPPANIPPASSVEWLETVQVPEYGNCIWVPTVSVDGPKLYKTTDKGYNWTVTDIPGTNSDYMSFAAFQNENIGMRVVWQWSQANAVLERTTDGGVNWNEISGPYGGCVPLNVSYVPGTASTYVITGDVNVNGYAGGSAYSTDFGDTWTNIDNGNYCYMIIESPFVGWSTEWTTSNFYKFTGIVPVELASFTSNIEGNNVTLNWSTSTETNNNGFEIERKSSSSEFTTIGFVEGQGTSTKTNNYSFIDKNLKAGEYSYRLKQVDFNGTYEYSKEINVAIHSVYSFYLDQNYPNPFNPTTTIEFGIKEKSNVEISIFNSIGQQVDNILNEEKDPGYYQVNFNAVNLPSGVYLYKITAIPAGRQAGNYTAVKKMLLLK